MNCSEREWECTQIYYQGDRIGRMRDASIAKKLVTSLENALRTKMVGSSPEIAMIEKDTVIEKVMIDMNGSTTAIEIEVTLIAIEVTGKGTDPIMMSAIGATTNTADTEGLLTQGHALIANPIGAGATTALNLVQKAMSAGMDNTATAGTTMIEMWGDLLLVIGIEMILAEGEIALIPVRTLALLVDDMDTQELILLVGNGDGLVLECARFGVATLHWGGGRWSFCIFVVVLVELPLHVRVIDVEKISRLLLDYSLLR